MAAARRPPKNTHPDPGDRAYLLRCWLEAGAGSGGEPAWRFALAEAGSAGPPRGFASLEALVAFLRGELAAANREDTTTVQ